MPKTFRPYAPDQMLLLPSSVQDWVPEGDMAHFISDVVDALDLSEIEAVYEEELRGYPPYHPRMMTKLWLYADAVGTSSCRKLAKLATRDVGCMMLAAATGRTSEPSTASGSGTWRRWEGCSSRCCCSAVSRAW